MAGRKKGHRSAKRKKIKPQGLIILLALGLICLLIVLYFNYSSGSENLDITQITELDRNYEVDETRGSPEEINITGIKNRRVAENRSSVFSWSLKLLFGLFFLASLVLNIFLIRKGYRSQIRNSVEGDPGGYSGKNGRKRELDRAFLNTPFSGEDEQLRRTIDKQQKEIKGLQEEVQLYKVQVENFNQKELPEEISSNLVSAKTSYISSLPMAPIEEEVIFTNFQPVVDKVFFEGPYDEAKFSAESGSIERKFRYLYRIEYGSSTPTLGTLHLEPTQVEIDILKNYSDNILKPACTYLNSFHSELNGIQQFNPGKVIRQGEDWIVQEKVQIKFI